MRRFQSADDANDLRRRGFVVLILERVDQRTVRQHRRATGGAAVLSDSDAVRRSIHRRRESEWKRRRGRHEHQHAVHRSRGNASAERHGAHAGSDSGVRNRVEKRTRAEISSQPGDRMRGRAKRCDRGRLRRDRPEREKELRANQDHGAVGRHGQVVSW